MAVGVGSGQDDRVPIPEVLRRLCEDPEFWAGRTGPEQLRVTLPVTAGYALTLDLGPEPGERTLGLRGPAAGEPVQLGWAAPGRPYPAALHWWELDLCARVIALEDPTLPHPGVVVALLSPFAPAGDADDPAEVAAVREAAYRSLRRAVEPPRPSGPEQAPLPLFTGAHWWPRPPAVSPQVVDEAAIAAYTTPAPVHLQVRAGERFPSELLDDLVRHTTRRLSRQSRDSCYAGARPLARRIASTGHLDALPELLGTLTEAGCDHPTVLDALSEPLEALEACWMIETLADVAPGTLLRHHV